MPLSKHWTERSTADFLYRIGLDFVSSLESAMKDAHVTQAELAKTLGVTEGRVSQVLNNPGNLTLKKIVEYARGVGRKVAIVTYDDGDPDNNNGPVDPEIFSRCWGHLNKPTDFFELKDAYRVRARSDSASKPFFYTETRRASTDFGLQRYLRSTFGEPAVTAE